MQRTLFAVLLVLMAAVVHQARANSCACWPPARVTALGCQCPEFPCPPFTLPQSQAGYCCRSSCVPVLPSPQHSGGWEVTGGDFILPIEGESDLASHPFIGASGLASAEIEPLPLSPVLGVDLVCQSPPTSCAPGTMLSISPSDGCPTCIECHCAEWPSGCLDGSQPFVHDGECCPRCDEPRRTPEIGICPDAPCNPPAECPVGQYLYTGPDVCCATCAPCGACAALAYRCADGSLPFVHANECCARCDDWNWPWASASRVSFSLAVLVAVPVLVISRLLAC